MDIGQITRKGEIFDVYLGTQDAGSGNIYVDYGFYWRDDFYRMSRCHRVTALMKMGIFEEAWNEWVMLRPLFAVGNGGECLRNSVEYEFAEDVINGRIKVYSRS